MMENIISRVQEFVNRAENASGKMLTVIKHGHDF